MNSVIAFIANYLIFVPPIVLVIVLLGLKQDQRIDALLILVLSSVLTVLLVKLATTLHQDARPFIRDGVTPLIHSSTDNGFPSDHSAFSTVIALVVMRFNRKIGYALFAVAVLIGTSRVLAGVHHTQDVIGGIVIAGISVGLSVLVLNAVRKTSKA
jgi:undecaprenyl-diphosphatase